VLIKELYLREGIYCREIKFTSKTLIYSKENSQGKTTLIRLILHSLGFNIPSNSGIKFEDIETKILLEIGNDKIILNRNGKDLYYNKNDINILFLLPKDRTKLHSLLFGINELHLIDNLLGAIYLDQTRGSVVLNRGDVIGNNHFSVEKFVAGLQGTNIDEITSLIEKEQKLLKDYKSMLSIAEYKINNNLDYVNVEESHAEDKYDYVKNMNLLKSRLNMIKKQIKEINESISDNNSFINIIENYKIYVNNPNGQEIPVNADTIQGFSDNRDLLNMQLKLLNIELKKVEQSITALKNKNDVEVELVDVDDYKKVIDEKMRGINIDYTKISSIVSHSEEKIKKLKESIKEKIKYNSSVVNYLNDEMFDCAEKLGVKKFIEKNGIFTSNIQNKSGAIFYKIILSFRIAFIKAIKRYKGIQMPFIIDSLRNSELTENTANEILEIIKEKLSGYQLIVASVYEYNDFFDNCFIIENKLINEVIEY
jgi:hypothetical protein